MITAPLYAVSHFLCPLPSISSHLSLFLICSLLPFSSHLSCLHLSFCRLFSNPIFLVFSPSFLSSLPSLSFTLSGVLCLFSPPPSYLLFSLVLFRHCFLSTSSSMSNISFYPLFFPCYLFVSFIYPLISRSSSLSLSAVCFSVNKSVLGLFTYSMSLLSQTGLCSDKH